MQNYDFYINLETRIIEINRSDCSKTGNVQIIDKDTEKSIFKT